MSLIHQECDAHETHHANAVNYLFDCSPPCPHIGFDVDLSLYAVIFQVVGHPLSQCRCGNLLRTEIEFPIASNVDDHCVFPIGAGHKDGMKHLREIDRPAVEYCRYRQEHKQQDEHDKAHHGRELKRVEIAEQLCRFTPALQHDEVRAFISPRVAQSKWLRQYSTHPVRKSLPGNRSVLRHQTDALHAGMVSEIDHVGHILKIHIRIAAHERDFLDSRQINPRQA